MDEENTALAGSASAPRAGRSGAKRSAGHLAAAVSGLVIIGIFSATVFDRDTAQAQAEAPPLPTVTVSPPLQHAIIEWDDYTGRFEASQAVEIRPRVSGQLKDIHFRDGEVVRTGQLLFTIDQRPFQAALAEAQARAASARTALELARSDYARAARLVDDEAVSREEVDALRAAVKTAEAGIGAADAIVQQRALDLEFTNVRAPIGGRISDRRVDVGNLVTANETMLTTLLDLNPIYFRFDGSEALFLKGQRAEENGDAGAGRVEIKLQDEADYRWSGRVDFTDNRLDPTSGTMRGRAVVANPDHFLTPGMFGNMRLASGSTRTALMVPDAAVRTDQARKVVYTVGPDGAVAVKPVEIGPRIGTLRTIRSGLEPDDRVVVEGIQLVQPGARVTTRGGTIELPSTDSAAPPPATVPAASQATLAFR